MREPVWIEVEEEPTTRDVADEYVLLVWFALSPAYTTETVVVLTEHPKGNTGCRHGHGHPPKRWYV